MLKYFCVLLVLSLTLNAEMVSRTKVLMGTFVTVSVDEKDKKHIRAVYKIINRVDDSLSSYKKNSSVFKLNRDKNSSIDFYLYEALKLSKNYYDKTDGYFNIAVGSITKDLYRFGEEEKVASEDELKNSNISIESLVFDEKHAFISSDIKIDLGGMGKGFAVDKAVEYLKTNDVKKAIVAASGDIRCLGNCKIEINNPLADKPLAEFITSKSNIGITTSGNYNRYVKNKKNNHLINPKLKHPQKEFISVTLISELNSSDLDAYATAVSVMPKKKAYKFLDENKIAYIILESSKELIISKNIDFYVDNLIINYTAKE
jgi:thiamine biosynthesis lipoprotein